MSSWINGNLQGNLSIGQGERGKSIEYEWRGTELGIKQEGEEEYQFVDLAGSGAGSGREIELQVGSGYIQWRYKGEEEWNNLISIDSLKGGKGDKGEQGERGPQGEQGPKGETGPQGPIGEQGLQGLPGKDGADGADGAHGSDGKSLEFNWNGTELGVKQEGQPSYSYVNLKGQDGRDGVDGTDGTNGKDGVTPNLQVGTVTTLEAGQQATVIKRGTTENPIFDFAIPQGQRGNDGADGITPDMTEFKNQINGKYEHLEQQHNTFETSITSAVNGIESRVTTLENSTGSGGSTGSGTSVDLTNITNRVNELETKHDNFETTITDRVSVVESKVTALENSGGSSSGGSSSGGTTKTLIHNHTVTQGTILNITNLDTSTGQFTTDTDFNLASYGNLGTPIKKEGVNYLEKNDIPSGIQNLDNTYVVEIIDNTFKLKNKTSYDKTGNFNKYGILVDGIREYTINNIFEANKNYEIEIYTSQPNYYTALKLANSVSSFNSNNGYVVGCEQYSTYLGALPLLNAEGINFVKHKINLYNYSNSFKLEIESIFDGLNSNNAKYKFNKFEYNYNGNIMTNFNYLHFRNFIAKGTTIKIYELGGN